MISRSIVVSVPRSSSRCLLSNPLGICHPLLGEGDHASGLTTQLAESVSVRLRPKAALGCKARVHTLPARALSASSSCYAARRSLSQRFRLYSIVPSSIQGPLSVELSDRNVNSPLAAGVMVTRDFTSLLPSRDSPWALNVLPSKVPRIASFRPRLPMP